MTDRTPASPVEVLAADERDYPCMYCAAPLLTCGGVSHPHDRCCDLDDHPYATLREVVTALHDEVAALQAQDHTIPRERPPPSCADPCRCSRRRRTRPRLHSSLLPPHWSPPMTDRPLHRYIVVEHIDAWSEWVVEAANKQEAIQKVKDGDVLDEGASGDDGPTGRYTVMREPTHD